MKTFKGKNNEVLGTFLENTDVVVNPTLVGDEPEMTGIQVGGQKYKAPQGGGGGGASLVTPLAYLLDNEIIYECVFKTRVQEGFYSALSFKYTEMFEHLASKGLSVTNVIDGSKPMYMCICPYSSQGSETSVPITFTCIETVPQSGSGLGKSSVGLCIGAFSEKGDIPTLAEYISGDFTLYDLATIIDNGGYALDMSVWFNQTDICDIIENIVIFEYVDKGTGEKVIQKIVIDDLSAFITACGQIVNGS